jgi:hypothetical protein
LINADKVQGVSGNLASGQSIALRDISIVSPMNLAHVVLVSLDNRPISDSKRMIVQIINEEKPLNSKLNPGKWITSNHQYWT